MNRGIKAIREARGLSLRDLAAKTGIGTSTIGNFETGRTELSPAFIQRLATALGCSELEIFGRYDTPASAPEVAGAAPDLDYLFERWNRLPAEQQREVFPRLLGQIECHLEHRGSINRATFSAAFDAALRRGEARAAAALPPSSAASIERWLESPAGQRCLARAARRL